MEQIKSNQVEQSSRQSYERIMPGIFANFKGSAPQVSSYLKSLGEDDIRQICEGVAQDSGSAGSEHAWKGLERETNKNAMELAGYRQQLRRHPKCKLSHLPLNRFVLPRTSSLANIAFPPCDSCSTELI